MILAIDVGKGTEDILLWNKIENYENALQLILPSTSQLLQKRIDRLIAENDMEPILIHGELMAGEPWHNSVYKFAKNHPGLILMSKTSARSLRYNLDQVSSKGIKIISDDEILEMKSNIDEHRILQTYDINWKRIFDVIKNSNIDLQEISAVLICCQDHGEPENPNRSSRDFRMSEIYSRLDKRGLLHDLLMNLDEIPTNLPRLKAVSLSAKKAFPNLNNNQIFVMDSSPAVILGALENQSRQIIINVGNGHTVLAILKEDEIQIIYELHTGGIDSEKITNDIELIFQNRLTHEDSLKRGGHGIYLKNKIDITLKDFKIKYYPIKLIGPNRLKLKELDIEFLHPGGSMMMAGPIGLIKAYKKVTNS